MWCVPWFCRRKERSDLKPRMPLRLVVDSFLFGTAYGHTLLLCLTAALLIAIGAGMWMYAGRCGGQADADGFDCHVLADHVSFVESLFFSWCLFFDPGTQMALHPGAPSAAKGVAIFFSITGFVFNLVVLGMVVERCRVQLDRWQRLYRRVIANGHTVVLGWTDKTLFLLEEQAHHLWSSSARGGRIVVLGELDTREMKEEVAVAFPNWGRRFPGVHLTFRQGKACEVDDLMRVSVRSARCVIVLGASRRPCVADANAITTCSALRCLPEGHKLSRSTLVVAELNLMQNVSVARQVAGHSMGLSRERAAESMPLLPATSALVVDHALVLSATLPAAGLSMCELMSMQGCEIHTVGIEPLLQDHCVAHITFGKLAAHFRESVVVGILRRNKRREENRAEAEAKQQSEAVSDIQKRLSTAWDESGIGRSTSRMMHNASTGAQLVRQQTVGGAVRLAMAIDMSEHKLVGEPHQRSPDRRDLDGELDESLRRARAADGSIEVVIAPNSSEVVREGDQLLVIAEDELKASTISTKKQLAHIGTHKFIQLAEQTAEENAVANSVAAVLSANKLASVGQKNVGGSGGGSGSGDGGSGGGGGGPSGNGMRGGGAR